MLCSQQQASLLLISSLHAILLTRKGRLQKKRGQQRLFGPLFGLTPPPLNIKEAAGAVGRSFV
jgi:hypothetical protein